MTPDLKERLAKLPNVLYSRMLPAPDKGPATSAIYEASRNKDGTWDISLGHRRDHGVSVAIRVDMGTQIAKGLDFVMMMERMRQLETAHPNVAHARRITNWGNSPYYRDYEELEYAVMEAAKTSSATMRRSRWRKTISRRPS